MSAVRGLPWDDCERSRMRLILQENHPTAGHPRGVMWKLYIAPAPPKDPRLIAIPAASATKRVDEEQAVNQVSPVREMTNGIKGNASVAAPTAPGCRRRKPQEKTSGGNLRGQIGRESGGQQAGWWHLQASPHQQGLCCRFACTQGDGKSGLFLRFREGGSKNLDVDGRERAERTECFLHIVKQVWPCILFFFLFFFFERASAGEVRGERRSG